GMVVGDQQGGHLGGAGIWDWEFAQAWDLGAGICKGTGLGDSRVEIRQSRDKNVIGLKVASQQCR
ncbi:hypothetical protein, partial [Xanthomonas fragariae]|uniref:hypothetical protein n=1 Tax=Xanthomonas fragariae TaxID=48664 RepID=UPI001F254A3D